MKIVIVGAGQIGFHVAQRLSDENLEVTIIESDGKRMQEIRELIDAEFIQANGSSPEVLKQAQISKAEMLLAVTNRDEINIVSCLVAQMLNPAAITIARVREPDFQKHRELFLQKPLELDLFINPEVEAAERIMRIIKMPMAEDILEFGAGLVQLLGFRIEQDSPVANKTLIDLGKSGLRVLVAGIQRNGHWIIPRGDTKLLPGDVAYISTPQDSVAPMLKALGKEFEEIRSVAIYGGTNIGMYLAKRLEQRKVRVKIIEPDLEVCTRLAGELKRTVVLNGLGTDEALLKEESIGEVDVFVALTADEEENILSALLAKTLGAKFTITLTNKASYAHLVRNIGIDAAVSPQVEAIGAIMRFIRRGKVRQVAAMREDEAEALEFEALETSDIVGAPIKELNFPKGAVIMAVMRDDKVLIPNGELRIQPKDRVLIFARKEAIKSIETLFSVKLQFV